MSDAPVRFGLVGYGAWGQHHAASIARTSGAELVAIAEPSAESQAAAHQAHPDAEIVAVCRRNEERDGEHC